MAAVLGATVARRGRVDRAARWARRHPLLTYVLVVAAGTVAAWACEYASSGTPAALCRLRAMLQERLGELVDQVLRRPLAP